MPWNPPALQLKWGQYFREDVAEQAQIVTMTVAAKTAGIVTTEQAVEKVADIYGTDDTKAVLESLQKEADERQRNALEQVKATGPKPNEGPPKE
jgi:N-methylhydantoinase B/oxoprolinase/acetone carboxylase alpha subunit